MIRINLVPQDQQKTKKHQAIEAIFKDIPLEVSVGLVGGFLAFIFAINILLQGIIFLGVGNTKRLEGVWQGMSAEREKVNKVTGDLDRLRQKFAAIENIKNSMKISWAQKLNIVSDAILPGIWLNRFAFDKDKILIQGNSVSKRGDYLASINRFNTALKNEAVFMKGLKNIEVTSIERKTIEAGGLAGFVITATLDKNYEQVFNP